MRTDKPKAYGYEYLPLLLTLASTSLGALLPNPLPSSSASLAVAKLPYNNLRKSLRLVTDEPEELEEPTDISYVYSGFAPLSVRLVQCVVQKGTLLKAGDSNGDNSSSKTPKPTKTKAHPIVGWKGFEDVIESLPGETIDVIPDSSTDNTSAAVSMLASSECFGGKCIPSVANQSAKALNNERRITTSVVFFLGGCTYTEIAALRWINSHLKGNAVDVDIWFQKQPLDL
jgi:hypothetical protein